MEYNLQKRKTYHYAVHLKLTQYCKSTILQFKKKEKDKKKADHTTMGV